MSDLRDLHPLDTAHANQEGAVTVAKADPLYSSYFVSSSDCTFFFALSAQFVQERFHLHSFWRQFKFGSSSREILERKTETVVLDSNAVFSVSR
jgi:hypothetical protein